MISKKVFHPPTIANHLITISEMDLTLQVFVTWHTLKIFKVSHFINNRVILSFEGLGKVNNDILKGLASFYFHQLPPNNFRNGFDTTMFLESVRSQNFQSLSFYQ
jgi:hypothetical protein